MVGGWWWWWWWWNLFSSLLLSLPRSSSSSSGGGSSLPPPFLLLILAFPATTTDNLLLLLLLLLPQPVHEIGQDGLQPLVASRQEEHVLGLDGGAFGVVGKRLQVLGRVFCERRVRLGRFYFGGWDLLSHENEVSLFLSLFLFFFFSFFFGGVGGDGKAILRFCGWV